MKMLGKGKKIVSVAYKEKLLAEIAHYEKRIEDALTKRKHNSFDIESFDDELNPYKLKEQQSWYDLKQQEASLSDRVSMTLELSMLTIIQSEVNVMVTPPEVRKPVPEDGIWLDVAAECQIDLVQFTITFYAHKPHRRFAPTRYRNLVVGLGKPAHEKELSKSVLSKLNRPHLALQVLQSYATAVRSRRTTLKELAEIYADDLKMEAMPEGGYSVRFLDVLQVEWTLENMWSPIVPFCHRMKFEIEYMPKDYIHAIGKLYKQFKDPSLETSERTGVLSKIFDTCMEARGLAREIQESFESDPETASYKPQGLNCINIEDPLLDTIERTRIQEIQESCECDPKTASRLHERRTTIDQEPEVPDVDQSPKKPKGKENKAQNRKTNMAPPKTIPKKAKKVDAKKDNERISVKRTIDSDASNDAKKSRTDDNDDNTKKPGLRGGKDGVEGNGEIEAVSSKINAQKRDTDKEKTAVNEAEVVMKNYEKKISGKSVKNAKEVEKVSMAHAENDAKKMNGESASKSSDNPEGSGDANKKKKGVNKKRDAGNIAASTEDRETESSEASSKKRSKKSDDKNTDSSKDPNTENNVPSSKNVVGKGSAKNDAKTVASAKNDQNRLASSKGTNKGEDGKSVDALKDKNVVSEVAKYNNKTTKGDSQDIASYKDKKAESNPAGKKRVKDAETASSVSSKPVAKTGGDKIKTVSKTLKNNNDEDPNKVLKNVDIVINVASEVEKNKDETGKKGVPKDGNTAKHKDVKNVASQKSNKIKITENNSEQTKKLNETGKNTKNDEDVTKKVEKNKPTSDVKTTAKDKNTETAQVERKRAINTNEQKSEQFKNKATMDKVKSKVSAQKIIKNDELSKKTKSDSVDSINKEQPKKTADIKSVTKSSENTYRNIHTDKTNRFNTQVLKEKTGDKKDTKTNDRNYLNVTITKSKNVAPLKSQGNQIKIADKLKTKIPVVKKMTFSSLRNTVSGNIGRISKVEKPKVTQKLTVFKKDDRKLPTRISPRKLPSTFKPSSQGFTKI